MMLANDKDSLATRVAYKMNLKGPRISVQTAYTSGSKAKPTGVQVTHGNVTRLFASTNHRFGYSQHDIWTMFHSCSFDFSVWEIWGALLHGGRLVIVPS